MMARQPGKVLILAFHNLVRVSLSLKHPYLSSFVVSQTLTILLSHLFKARHNSIFYSGNTLILHDYGIRGQIIIAKPTLTITLAKIFWKINKVNELDLPIAPPSTCEGKKFKQNFCKIPFITSYTKILKVKILTNQKQLKSMFGFAISRQSSLILIF